MTETRSRSRWRGRGASFVLGAIPALAFPEPGLWWLAFAGLVPVLIVIARAASGRDAAVRGWLAGTGFLMALTHWLVPKVGPGLVLFAGIGALAWVPPAWVWWQTRTRPALAAILVPSAWVVGEFARSSQYLGGPWGVIGTSLWQHPALLALASVGGMWAVSFAVVAINVGLAARRTAGIACAAGAMALMLAFGTLRPEPATIETLRVVGVQPGIVARDDRVAIAIAHSRDAARGDPDLVVWGESSVGTESPEVLAAIARAAHETGAPILVNVDARRDEGGIFKSSVLVTAAGEIGRYDKVRLVPFGEYVPVRRVLGWLPNVTDAPEEDRRRGPGPKLIALGDVSIGPLVCFESTFPDMARTLVRMGADVVVVQSATSTFQQSWAPEQHAALAAIRAVETGRPVVHATLTGASALYDARGRRLTSLGTGGRGVYGAELSLTTETTLYIRFGDWVPATSLIALAAWILGERRRKTSSP